MEFPNRGSLGMSALELLVVIFGLQSSTSTSFQLVLFTVLGSSFSKSLSLQLNKNAYFEGDIHVL